MYDRDKACVTPTHAQLVVHMLLSQRYIYPKPGGIPVGPWD